MSIVPLSDVLVVRSLREEKTKGGLVKPVLDPKQGEIRRAEVVVGHKGWWEDGIFHDSRVQVGDVVIYVFPGTEIEHAGEKLWMIHERDILGRNARKDEDAPKVVAVKGETEEKW
jgi:co-chaperonin GroES (HSP10)